MLGLSGGLMGFFDLLPCVLTGCNTTAQLEEGAQVTAKAEAKANAEPAAEEDSMQLLPVMRRRM